MKMAFRLASVLAALLALGAGAFASDDEDEMERRQKMRFERLDRDGSGGLSFEEFSDVLLKRLDRADRNGDGRITLEELTTIFRHMNAGQMAERLMMRFDADGDGALTFEEVRERQKRMFSRLDRNGDGSLDPDELPKGPSGPGMGGGPGMGAPGAGRQRPGDGYGPDKIPGLDDPND